MIETLLEQYSTASGHRLSDEDVTRLARYAELIAKWNRVTNLVAAAATAELAHTHIIDCLAAVPFIDGRHIVDVGSGAGLPGVVIAMLRPQSRVTLVESRQRKARFLRQAVIELGLNNTAVAAERIERWRPAQAVDCFVCRGYSSLQKFYDDTLRLHHPGCRLIALRGTYNDAELAALQLPHASIAVIPLTVPGWTHRHLVTIECPS